MFEWIIANKPWLQWVAFLALASGTVLTGLLNMASGRQTSQEHRAIREGVEKVSVSLEELRSEEGIARFLQDIKIESLRKYLSEQELEQLKILLKEFSISLAAQEVNNLRRIVGEILKIIPTDPFFRVYGYLLSTPLMRDVFAGEIRVVQVIRWEWIIEGEESVELLIFTEDDSGNRITHGPFRNNRITMLEKPLHRYVQFRIQGGGKGHWEFHPRSFRIGWSIARKKNGEWEPDAGIAEYDPFLRFGIGGLES